MRVKPDQIIDGFDSSYYLSTQPDVAAAGVDPLFHFNTFGWKEGRNPGGIFNVTYYLQQNQDVAAANVNPLQHYLSFGAAEHRGPSATFDGDAYLAANPDVAAAGVNPLQHYLTFGAFEGRSGGVALAAGTSGNDYLIGTSGSELINSGGGNDFVIAAGGNDTADGGSGIDTVRFSSDFLAYTFTFVGNQVIVDGPEGHDVFTNFERFAFRDGTIDRNDSNPLVDNVFYYAQNPDVWAAGVDAATHFAEFGWREGRSPSAFFDIQYYLANNPDVAAAGVNPLEHYLAFGAAEGRNPSAFFDTTAYLAANPDVAASGINPLLHFLQFGRSEGRSPLGTSDDVVVGTAGDDTLFGGGGRDVLIGGSGDDTLYGDVLVVNGTRSMGVDRADYSGATGPINVQLAAGTVTGDGNDLLVSIELVTGTNSADVFDATGYSATSTNGGGIGYQFSNGLGGMGNFNAFEGVGGNDEIIGNGATRISFLNATAGVTVTMTSLGSGTATGDASVGTDTFSGVNQVRGSNHNDTITGSQNGSNLSENFEGLRGDDFLDGNGGFDRARYDFESTGSGLGILVNLGAGTVTGRDAAATAVVGFDTLRSIEAIRGTHSADIYDASTFTANSINGGATGGFTGAQNLGNLNEFEGFGGDDQITGNGNTRLSYYNATGVAIIFTAAGVGTATGDASVGTDTFLGGVNHVRGSNYDDTFTGFNNGTFIFEQFEGLAGDDFIDGGLGLDQARYDSNNGDAGGMPMGPLGLIFNMAAGTATFQDAAGEFNYGTDTLRSIEVIRGTNSDDVYNAAGFTTSSTNAGSSATSSDGTAFNQFEGGLGDDDITGNGGTRVSYQTAGGSVNVNLATGAISADSAAGNDTFHGGINAVRGSNFNDTLTGTNAANISELFEGLAGNDTIDGLGDFDQARYDNHNTGGFGITVTRDAGSSQVTGINGTATQGVGTDTLFNIESVRGTNFADTYNASGFVGFNEFEGLNGNDDITGSGQTRISYQNAGGAVTIDLVAQTVTGSAGSDTLHGGINAVRGSQFTDLIRGSAGNDFLTGLGGSDTFVYTSPAFGNDTITDFVAGAGSGHDVVMFDDTVFADFNAVMAASAQNGADVVITLNGFNSITLQNVTMSNLHFDDFLFT